MKKILAPLMILLLAASPASAGIAIGYNITDLGALFSSGTTFGAKDINESGQVALNPDGIAFVWDNGVLSPPGGVFNNNTSFQINDDAHLTYTHNLRAQFYNGVTVTQLPTLENGLTSGQDINSSDHIVGTSYVSSLNRTRAYLWDGTTMTDLGSLPATPNAEARALGINDAGVIVGSAGDSPVPVRWVSGVINELMVVPAQSLGRGSAEDINEAGQIAGTLFDTSFSNGMAARWAADGTVTLLNRLPGHGFSRAEAINGMGDVVGWSSTSSSGSFGLQAAFFDNGVVHNLNDFTSDPNWNLTRAWGINTAGQIVGVGLLNGNDHAFLLSAIIPEPSRALLLVLGAATIFLRRRRAGWTGLRAR